MNFAPGDVTETAPSQRNKASDLDGKGDGEKDLGAVADVIPVNNVLSIHRAFLSFTEPLLSLLDQRRD